MEKIDLSPLRIVLSRALQHTVHVIYSQTQVYSESFNIFHIISLSAIVLKMVIKH